MKNKKLLMILGLGMLLNSTLSYGTGEDLLNQTQAQQTNISLTTRLASWGVGVLVFSGVSSVLCNTPLSPAIHMTTDTLSSVLVNMYTNYRNGDMTSARARSNLVPASVKDLVSSLNKTPFLTSALCTCGLAGMFAKNIGISSLYPLAVGICLKLLFPSPANKSSFSE